MLAGGQLTYTVTGTVPSSVQGQLVNTATVTPPPADRDPGCSPNCSATATTPAQPTVGLSVTKTSTPDPYLAGATPDLHRHRGQHRPLRRPRRTRVRPATGRPRRARLHLDLRGHPRKHLHQSGAGDITDIVNVAAGGHVTYTITGTVPPATTGQLVNTATVTPPTGASDPGCDPCTATNTNPSTPHPPGTTPPTTAAPVLTATSPAPTGTSTPAAGATATSMASTGDNIVLPVKWALAFIIAGATLTLASRRRKQHARRRREM